MAITSSPIYFSSTNTTNATISDWIIDHSTSATSTSATSVNLVVHKNRAPWHPPIYDDKPLRITKEYSGEIILPDGSKIVIDKGNYKIIDKDAKITYKAHRNREFNRYLNGSDLLEEFIGYLKTLNLSKQEVMQLPVESFIMWLIIRAAEHDDEEKESTLQEHLLLTHQVKTITKPQCKCCGRFITQKRKFNGIDFCSGVHMDRYMAERV